MNACKEIGCGKPVRSLGWCTAHYYRNYRHGSPSSITRTPPNTPLLERLGPDKWVSVDRGFTTECWEWKGNQNPDGYGILKVNGRSERTHRLMFEQHVGNIDPGKNILHRCDNPPCGNPAHLFSGTQEENIQDMFLKGRSRSHRPRTDAEIRGIRAMVKGGATYKEVGAVFGADSGTISRIVNRKLYRDVL